MKKISSIFLIFLLSLVLVEAADSPPTIYYFMTDPVDSVDKTTANSYFVEVAAYDINGLNKIELFEYDDNGNPVEIAEQACNPEGYDCLLSHERVITSAGDFVYKAVATDTAGKRDIVDCTTYSGDDPFISCSITVISDEVAPTTSDDAPTGWQNADFTITLTEEDADSGVASTFYCVDTDDTCTPDIDYTAPVTISAEGSQYFRYYSIDNAGNQQALVSKNIQLDKTAPTTTDDAPAGWQNADFDITLTETDALSDIASTMYCVDTADTCTPGTAYTAPVTISTEGDQYFRYQSTDNAGNVQTVVSRNIQLDKTAPTTTDDAPAGWHTADFSITLTLADTGGSGVASTFYCVDTDDTCTPGTEYTAPVTISSEGNQYFRYASTDNAGNAQTIASRNIQLDKTAPTTTDDAPTGWQSADFDITLTETDALSEIASTMYCVDTADTCTPGTAYTTPVVISTEASQYFRYQSTDNAGNVQTLVSKNIQLDKSAPAISSFNPAAGSTVSDTKRPLINASLFDGLSGVDVSSVKIAVNGADVTASAAITTTEVRYTPASDLADGTIIVEVNASDNIGNPATVSWSFTLGVNDAPVITSYIPVDLTPSVNEGKSLLFNHTSMDPDGNPLSYEWLLDSIVQATTQSWIYEPDFNSQGSRNVTLTVTDGLASVSQEWNVSVINITRNIIVDNLTIPGGYMFLNEEYDFTVEVTNDADTIEKDVAVNFYVDDSLADTFTIASLNEFSTTTVTFSHTFTTTGNHQINVSVDPVQDESSINDNFIFNLAGVNVKEYSDVLFPVLSIPKKVQPNGNMTAIADVWNFGGDDIQDVPVDLNYDTSLFNLLESSGTPISLIVNNNKGTATFKLNSLGEGIEWTLSSMYASAFNDANSSLEYINTSLPSSPILSTSIGLPPFFPEGATLDIPVYVFNTGNETAHDTIVTIMLSSGLSTTEPLIKSAGDIDADDFKTITWPITVGPTGPYTIDAIATSDDGDYSDSDSDSGDTLTEPELDFTEIIMSENITTDATTPIIVLIKNHGTALASDVSVSLIQLPPSVEVLTTATQSIDINTGETKSVYFYVNSTEDANDLSLNIIVEHIPSAYSKTLAKTFNSVPSGADNEPPEFYEITIVPSLAQEETVAISFTVSEELIANPTVLVGSNPATFNPPPIGSRYTYTYNVTTADPEGEVTVTITGTDLNGNPGSADAILTIDYTAPVIDVIENPDFFSSGYTAVITITEATLDDSLTGTISISQDAITYISNAPIANNGDGTYAYDWDTTGYPSGLYDLTVILDDGMQTDTASFTITIDNPPSITLNSPIDNAVVSDMDDIVRFDYTVNEDNNVVSCTLWTDFSGAWEAGPTDYGVENGANNYFNVEDVSNGNYEWNVRCVDDRDYSSFASENEMFTVNFVNDAPTVSIGQPSDGDNFSVNREIDFRINSEDPEGESLTITYNFGDGDSEILIDETNTTHTYTANDTYTVTVTVDDGELTASDSITVNIMPLAFNITNIQTYNEDNFIIETSDFFRNQSVYVNFNIVDLNNPSEFVPDAIADVYLYNEDTGYRVDLGAYDNGGSIRDGQPWPTPDGSYYYYVESLPLIDDVLGWNIVFVFAYTPAGSGQSEKRINVHNNPLVFNTLPDISFVENTYNDSLDLDDYVYDLETPLNEIEWSYSGNSDINVEILDNHVVNFTAVQDYWTGSEVISFTANDTDGSTFTRSLTVTVTARDNVAPVANAGDDQAVDVDTLVTLNGSGTDGDGDPITYSWSFVSGPITVDLSDPSIANPSFIPPLTGIYVFELIVNDGRVDSIADTVNIYVALPNIPPTADAGPDQPNVIVGDLVTLDGSGSYDFDLDPITSYSWSQVSGPSVTLSNPTTVNPSFTPTEVGTYIFSLIVSDGQADSEPDTVSIFVSEFVNSPPTANAGPDQPDVEVGGLVTLDGSGSDDPDNDTITYSWSFVSGPLTVELSDPTIVNPTFTAPMVGEYVFRLIVNDGQLDSSPDTVTIFVISSVNNAPSADAGDNQDKFVNDLVTLDGSGSFDPDGDTITYSWTQLTGPTVILSDSTAISPSFTTEKIGTYTFQLIVNDGEFDSSPDTVTITVKEVPKPKAIKKKPKLEIPSIRLPMGESYLPGDSMDLRFNLENDGNVNLKDLQINAMVMDTEIFATTGSFDLKRGKSVSKRLDFDIPDDIEPGDYYIRISIGNPNTRTVRYRLITIE